MLFRYIDSFPGLRVEMSGYVPPNVIVCMTTSGITIGIVKIGEELPASTRVLLLNPVRFQEVWNATQSIGDA